MADEKPAPIMQAAWTKPGSFCMPVDSDGLFSPEAIGDVLTARRTSQRAAAGGCRYEAEQPSAVGSEKLKADHAPERG